MPISDSLSTTFKILARMGDTWTEQELQNAANNAGELFRSAPISLGSPDSEEEQAFYTNVLGAMVGPHVQGWVLTQPLIGSLTGDPLDIASNQRADFAILHPCGIHIVLEIDGQQHLLERARDQERDEKLRQSGFEVVRLEAEAIRQRDGIEFRSLVNRLRAIPEVHTPQLSALGRWLLFCKRAHQIQLSILEWLAATRPHFDMCQIGVHVELDKATSSLLDNPNEFLGAVVEDLSSFIGDLSAARGETGHSITLALHQSPLIRLNFDSSAGIERHTGYIADAYAPVPISAGLPKGVANSPGNVDTLACERVLRRLFGFPAFREGQAEAVTRALNGLDSVLLLPTGSGKSIAFQLSALVRSGVCIVVDPILSLVDDQIDNLRSGGTDRVVQITGNLTTQQRSDYLELIQRGEFLFCYIAPERFQDENFRNSLLTMTAHTPVSLVAIDEAHCVSEWGHDFRPSYLNLARNARNYCQSATGPPPLMALTGTASHSVLKDVQRELGISQFEAIITPATFDRAELTFDVLKCRSVEKTRRLHGILLGLPDHFSTGHDMFYEASGEATSAGLLFCPHTNGDHGVVELATAVSSLLQRPVPFYSGQPPRGFSPPAWTEQKRKTAFEFKHNVFTLMACTKAFGMGIDKPNVRYTIHYNLPASIESFYQEAGRAGRDRRPARCTILFANDDTERTQHLLAPATEIDEIRSIMDKVTRPTSDDITRMLYFHINSFRGIEVEMAGIENILELLGDLLQARRVLVSFDDDDKTETERAIHRLLVLGVVRDYTIDYSKKHFAVEVAGASQEEVLSHLYRYLAAYQRQRAKVTIQRSRNFLGRAHVEFVRALAEQLIDFVYDVIERGRRRNLREMLSILENAKSGEDVRRGILEHLQKSRFSQQINELSSRESAGLAAAIEIIWNIRSSIDASEVRGEAGRALASYPDYPGLLLLRAAAEALTSEPSESVIVENARAAAQMAVTKYEIPLEEFCGPVLQSALLLCDERPAMAKALLVGTISNLPNRRSAARIMLEQRPERLVSELVGILLSQLNFAVSDFVRS